MTAVGVDGWRGRWVAASLEDGAVRWRVHDTFASVLGAHPGVVAVDMPVGTVEGPRSSDTAAREFLRAHGGPWQSIFLTPTSPTVDAYERGLTHAQAMAARPAGSAGTSVQAWNLLPAMVDVRDAITASGRTDVHEAHPECSFRALDPAIGPAGKKTGLGAGRRLRALGTQFAVELAEAPPDVPVDDLLDAAAVLWTARRVERGEAFALGDGPRILV
jgi:predicted RNase H-like nuclease